MRNFDILSVKLEAIQKVGKTGRTPTQSKTLVDLALPLLDDLIAQDRYEDAVNLGAMAVAAARNTLDGAILQRAVNRMRQVEDLARAFDGLKPSLAKVEQSPADREANLAIGRFRCLVKGDWPKGLPMLAANGDAPLGALALRELGGKSPASELADGWWDLAENEQGAARRQLQIHAAAWYQQALPGLNGPLKAKFQQRIDQSRAATALPF